MKKQIQWHSQHIEFSSKKQAMAYAEDEDLFNDSEEGDGELLNAMVITDHIMASPLGGYYSIDDDFNPLKQFELWQGDSNFDITESILNQIAKIDGIEIVKAATRYKFYIGVGKMFSFTEVRLEIETLLCDNNSLEDVIEEIKDEQVRENIQSIAQDLNSTGLKWAMYIFPNGVINFSTANDIDYDEKLKLYSESEEYSQGLFITSGE